MTRPSSLFELETLFIEKLTEKYRLNKVDLKKAFSLFDLDQSGVLNLTELASGIKLYLNGIEENKVQELIECYDINGDGSISFEEFLAMLLNRNATKNTRNSNATNSKLDSGSSSNHFRSRESSRNSYGDVSTRSDVSSLKSEGREIPRKKIVESSREKSRREELIQSGKTKLHIPPQKQRPLSASAATRRPVSSREIHNTANTSQVTRGYRESDDRSISSRGSSSVSSQSPSDSHSVVSHVDSVFDPTNINDVENRCRIFIQNLKAALLRSAISLRKSDKLANRLVVNSSTLANNVGRALLRAEFQKYAVTTGRDTNITFPHFCKCVCTNSINI
jgi:hypothetical protein